MKKLLLLIIPFCLCLLTIGTNGQAPVGSHYTPKVKQILAHHNWVKPTKLHKAQGGANNALINYVQGDQINDPSQIFYYWLPPLYLNMAYTLADTVSSPLITNAANTNTANYCTVIYDTLWDYWTQSYLTDPVPGSAEVDTIWANLAYHNTSGKTDTLVLEVCSVDVNGFPSNTIYGSDTAYLNALSLTYNVLDSNQLAYIVPSTPISIPGTARHGWNFCIKMKVYGSKLDTLGPWYYSPGAFCTGFAITNAYTVMGIPNGRDPAVNSFVTGLYWFNDAEWFGDGSQMTWPLYNQPFFNGWQTPVNNFYYFYDNVPATCTDSSYFPMQDIAIYASINYSIIPLGANQVNSGGLSVSQNFPNPFSQQTTITYSLAASSDVVFSLYDIAGRELVNNKYPSVAPGQHEITLNANQFSPGIYFYRFNVNGKSLTRKMVITQ